MTVVVEVAAVVMNSGTKLAEARLPRLKIGAWHEIAEEISFILCVSSRSLYNW
jgi:hypothetical protein